MVKAVVGLMSLFLIGVIGYQLISQNITASYQFEKQYLYAWNLADKSSTIEAKAKYIAEFVEKLDTNKEDFAKNNASWMSTPDNSFEKNLEAVKTLNARLKEVMKMDVTSFQYNTAIQQITAQEQGEAQAMLSTLYGCWLKEKYSMIWSWHEALWVLALAVFIITALVCLCTLDY